MSEQEILDAFHERREARLALDKIGRKPGFIAASERYTSARDAVRNFESRCPRRTEKVRTQYLNGLTTLRSSSPHTRI